MKDGADQCGFESGKRSALEGDVVALATAADLSNEEIAAMRAFFILLDAWDKDLDHDS